MTGSLQARGDPGIVWVRIVYVTIPGAKFKALGDACGFPSLRLWYLLRSNFQTEMLAPYTKNHLYGIQISILPNA